MTPPGLGLDSLRRNARAAIADDQLREALHRATGLFGQRRRAAAAALPDWEALRDRARAIKDETLADLGRWVDEFAARAERAGARVHRARDAAEACAIIAAIAWERGATTIVKSKSMVSEEVHLNEALARRGIEAVETDLGEYIIQLAGETPSHLVAPAIHKTRQQVAALFHDKLGTPPGDDVTALTAAARQALRRRFAEADLGLSGVNFAVAETGTILILENEGNARMCTSLPRTHVALMGIEKVIPRFADLDVFLQLLPRSGTGQALTSYQSLITGPGGGPDPAGDGPAGEGPEELHIVILDNGRSRMLADPLTRQTLACIRCGACLNACPVYQQIGGHAYGSVYAVPIGAVLSPQLFGIDRYPALPFASSLCGACRDVCPVKIDIPALLLHLRARVVETGGDGRRRRERLAFRAFAALMARPRLLGWAARAGRALQRTLGLGPGAGPGRRRARALAPALAAWSAGRDLPVLPARSFRELWRGGLADAPPAHPAMDTPRGPSHPSDGGGRSAAPPETRASHPAMDMPRTEAHPFTGGVPAAQEVPGAFGVPGAQDVPGAPGVPDAAGLPDAADAPGPTAVPPPALATPAARFAYELEVVGGRCVAVRDEAAAARALAGILGEAGCRRLAVSDDPLARRLAAAARGEWRVDDGAELTRDELFDCDAGLTGAQWGIAETGTLVLESARERHRLLSLVPPVHVAVLAADRICPALGEALARVAATGPDGTLASRAITLITGPSRSADIELTLTLGVHGPQAVHVIILQEGDEAAH